MPSELPPLSDQQRHSTLQIVREALANVARHAEASYVRITIHATDRKFHLAVQDDGKGFDTTEVSEENHFGLQNLHARARRMGGTLNIESEVNRGTTVYLVFPLKRVKL
jgi:NarL family two-component system sensor histidine kinase YdfH